ncbi:glycosyltransferase [Actinophytocola gossypii]|uniref:Erythromycin biosynthesis protein CIII-like C-terminal domain-containing protein n=1 Tax=Actinophytocola gossypii TaxID=2812003 RepID=A0ABT2J8R0_9PSEU|nr:nucleotide disphospho-sugar-binding domain-containing protein [Actinophytocola gossypii]MCT2584255.1 hypothetical protein [Actinophytocola gossypii]
MTRHREADMGSSRHVLFLSRPDTDHLYLTLAVAEELGRRGHAVTFATSDPFADEDADAGVVLLRYGRDERALAALPAFRARGPVDLVVADPRTRDAAVELAAGWGARVVVAHANLAVWPGERQFGENGEGHVYVHPAGRGTVFGDWTPADPRPVLVVAHDGVPLPVLTSAFGPVWQVVLLTDTPPADLPEHVTAVPPGFAALAHADVLLADGGLPAIGAAVRHATPVVLVPRSPEEHRNAARVTALGLGEVLPELTPESLRRTVSRVAADEATRAAARRFRSVLREAGSPTRVSDTIESALDAETRRAA